jgi:thioredoxin 1
MSAPPLLCIKYTAFLAEVKPFGEKVTEGTLFRGYNKGTIENEKEIRNMMELNDKLFQELMQGDKPVLVDFWAPWCVYCRRIAPAYEKIAQQYADRIVVAKLNIDEAPATARQERIEVIPTLVIYKNGQALGSIVAPESKARIEEFIRETLG